MLISYRQDCFLAVISKDMALKFKLNRRYFFVFYWLLRNTAWRFRKTFLAVVLLLATDLAAQMSAFGLVITYLNSLQPGRTFKILHHSFEQFNQTEVLIFVALLGGCVLMLSACATLLARFMIVRLMRSYEEFSGKRALKIFARSLDFSSVTDKSTNMELDILLRLVNKDARICARSINDILATIIPTCYVIATTCFAFYMNYKLTIGLILLFGIATYGYIVIGRKGALATMQIEKVSRNKNLKMVEGIKRLNSSLFSPQAEHSWIEKIYQSEAPKSFLDAFEQRLKISHIAVFVGSMQMALGIMIIVTYFGLTVDKTAGAPITYVLKYAIALRMCYMNMRILGRLLTNLNALYPFIERYIVFITKAGQDFGATNAHFDAIGEAERLYGRAKLALEFKPGSQYDLASDRVPDRVNLSYLMSSLAGAGWKPSFNAGFANSHFGPPILIKDFSLSAFGSLQKSAVHEILKTYPDHDLVSKIDHLLDARNNFDDWLQWPPKSKFVLACVYQKLQPKRTAIFLSADDLNLLSNAEKQFIENLFIDRVLFRYHRYNQNLPDQVFPTASILVISKGQLYTFSSDEYQTAEANIIFSTLKDRPMTLSGNNSTGLGDDILDIEDENF